jgi:low temperature requirement protein LtrA
VLSAISAFVNNDFQLLLLGLAVIIAWIIPGYILQNKYRKQSALS